MRFRRTQGVLIGITAVALTVSACGAGKKSSGGGGGSSSSGASGAPITVGTTDKVTALDPAGSYDNGSLARGDPRPTSSSMSIPARRTRRPQPDAAAELLVHQAHRIHLQDEVRPQVQQRGPAHGQGRRPSASSGSSRSTTPTVRRPCSATWPRWRLPTTARSSSPSRPATTRPGPTSSAPPPARSSTARSSRPDKLLPDEQIVGSGPYKIASYSKNQLVQFDGEPELRRPEQAQDVEDRAEVLHAPQSNLKLDVQSGAIDIAWRSLTPTDIDSLQQREGRQGPDRSGRRTALHRLQLQDDAGRQRRARSEAIRQAMAYSIDRQTLSRRGLQGHLQAGVLDGPARRRGRHVDAFKDAYGVDAGQVEGGARCCSSAGVTTPVALNIDYTTDHYGPTSDEEYGEIKRQLEATGLFKVNLSARREYTTYNTERVKDTYPIYQLGWFPDFVGRRQLPDPVPDRGQLRPRALLRPEGQTNRPCDTDGLAKHLSTEETHDRGAPARRR